MITNKDLSIDSENGKIVLNGDKYDLGTQGEIDTAVKDVYSVMGQMGAKNLFNSQYSVPRTNIGTTTTLGDYGHIIINGTANADGAQLNQSFKGILPIYDLKVGDKLILSYKVISGTFTHGSTSSKTVLYINDKNGNTIQPSIKFPSSLSTGDSGSAEITLNDDCFDNGVFKSKDLQLYIRNGNTFNNLELAIMVRLASDTDETYQPYAMTNKQLMETIGDLTQTGVTGASVAAQLEALDDKYIVQGKALGSSLVVTAGNFVRADIPCEISGYTPLGVLSVQGAATAGQVSLTEFGLSADETKVYIYYANDSATDKTLSDVRVRVLYRKN